MNEKEMRKGSRETTLKIIREIKKESRLAMKKKLENINNVCLACGITANYLTCLRDYGVPPIKPAFEISTWHDGKCELCGHKRSVTEVRDFFYPDFSLILRKIK